MIRPDLVLPLIKAFLLVVLGFVCLGIAQKRWKLLSAFGSEESSALNLALARVVIMTALISKVGLSYELTYSRMDKSLIVPPIGWSHLAAHVPRFPALVVVAYGLFVLFGILAAVGLYARLSCLVTSVTGFYLLTLPQLFGKINHDHHLVLFGFILAVSPCADTLSVDAIRGAVRLARRGIRAPKLKASVAYANPLKCMMVLMGLVYFFPGVWKVARAGAYWFSGDNMRWTMAATLLEAGHITAFQSWAMRHPAFLLGGAIFTPFFEMGFIFAIFSRYTRPFAAACGIAFHNMTGLLMNITFVSLQLCYVILIDWILVFSWIAARLDLDRIAVRCGKTRAALQLVNFIAKFDWLNLVSLEIADSSPLDAGDPYSPARPLIVVGDRGEQAFGLGACLCVMKRIVVLWPAYLLLRLPLFRRAAERLYTHFSSGVESSGATAMEATDIPDFRPQLGILFKPLSALLVVGMILAGVSHSVNAWPIACYPTFDQPGKEQIEELSATALGDDGRLYHQTLSFDPRISAALSPERYDAMVGILLREDATCPRNKAVALVTLWRQTYEYPKFKEVTFYSDTYLFDSDGRLGRLIRNREIFHLGQQDGLE
jgi:hypothetical protein